MAGRKFAHIPDRYVRTKADRDFLDGGGTFDISKGNRVCRFIETYVRTIKGFGAGDSVTLLDWQRHEFFLPLFSYLKPDSTRRFTEATAFCPRQNGKSFCLASTACYMMYADGEAGPDVVLMGPTYQQTKVLFETISHTIKSSPELAKASVVLDGTLTIKYPAKNGLLQGVSSEGTGRLGRPPSLMLADELCFWSDYFPLTAVRTGRGSRKQPLLLYASTSGHDRTTPAYSIWQRAVALLDGGNKEQALFPLVYAAKPDEPIDSLDVMLRCNPSAGISQPVEFFREVIEQAKASKTSELEARQFHRNEWVATINQHIPPDAWLSCAVGEFPDLAGKDAYLGFDLSSSGTDLTSVVAVIPHNGTYYVDHHSFTSRSAVDRTSASGQTRYSVFEQEGTLTVYEGDCIDYEDVRQHIRNLARTYNVLSIACDPSHNANDTMLALTAEGYPVQRFFQTASNYNQPMRRLVELVQSGKLAHRGDSCINWQAQNLESKADSLDRLIPHSPSREAKKDTMVSLLMALSAAIAGTAAPQEATSAVEFW